MFDMRSSNAGPATVAEHPHIWLLDGAPDRAVIDGRRWRVIDQPTRIGTAGQDWSPALTHTPTEWTGWRFTARADDTGETRIFDVADAGNHGWRLLHAWS